MFKFFKTKTAPEMESILEVLPEEPQLEQVVALDFVTVQGNFKYLYYGTLTDYDGQQYEFEWDNDSKRVSRLVGSRVSTLVWDQATQILEQHFNPVVPQEQPNFSQIIENSLQQVVPTLLEKLQELEEKVESLSKVQVVETPKFPLLDLEEVQELTENSFETMEEELGEQPNSLGDEDISSRALDFLRNSKRDQLNIDYLSL